MGGKYVVTTLGCKVNQYESQEYREVCETMGLRPAQPNETPDIAIVNTCAVTSDALRRSRQTVRRLARGGQTSVVVVGCGASAQREQMSNIDGVLAVWGHDVDVSTELRRLLSVNQSNVSDSDELLRVSATYGKRPEEKGYDLRMIAAKSSDDQTSSRNRSSPREIVTTSLTVVNTVDALQSKIHRFEGRHRAFLKIQDGCDAFCTYCIIPRLRPNLRSKPIEHVVEEARGLVEAGFKEIVLTGIFLGAYGRETAIRKRFGRVRQPLAGLVEALNEVDGLERLRLSSLEPGDVDDELLEVIRTSRNCVPHLHLPLQSGSERILRKMNRQYSRQDFLDMIDRVRNALREPAISTDMIVGFPGETDQNFEDSLDVARYAKFCKVHAFPFSPREQTAAARWQKEFVHPSVSKARMRRLAEVEAESSLAFRRRLVGTVERVIVEAGHAQEDELSDPKHSIEHTDWNDEPFHSIHNAHNQKIRWGRADRFVAIHFESDSVQPGDVVRVRINGVTPGRNHGTICQSRDVRLPVLNLGAFASQPHTQFLKSHYTSLT